MSDSWNHIGSDESIRLMGSDLQSGPLYQFYKWVRTKNEDKDDEVLEVIHLNSVDEDEDMSPLVFDQEAKQLENETFVKLRGINAFQDSNLFEVIESLAKRYSVEIKDIKIGLIGLHTESLILFLCYELKTRLRIENVAICSALTASRSRLQHFNTLRQIVKVLGVELYHSVQLFESWLLQKSSTELKHFASSLLDRCNIEIANMAPKEFNETKKQILCYMYRNSSSIHLSKLTGGVSGSGVYKVKSTDDLGHEQCITVLKIGSTEKVSLEKRRFEEVETVLGNHAPVIKDYIEIEDVAAIKFAYATMTNESKTFKSLYEDLTKSQKYLNKILTETFDIVLGKFYKIATFERHTNLFELYDFDGKGWAWWAGGSDTPNHVRERIEKIMGTGESKKKLISFSQDMVLPNVANFLEHELPTLKKNAHRIKDSVYMCYVHGDLNGRNILVDGNSNVWLIDFEYTKFDHALKDVLKLESDVMFEYTKIESINDFEEALKITQTLLSVEDLGKSLPEDIGLKIPKMKRCYATIKKLRELTASIIGIDRSSFQLDVVMLRYSLFSMVLPQLGEFQKKWALVVACGYAERIKQRSKNVELYVRWMKSPVNANNGNVSITVLPGRMDKGGQPQKDLQILKNEDISLLVYLVNQDELITLLPPNSDIISLSRKFGFSVIHKPIANHEGISVKILDPLVTQIISHLEQGKHCCLISPAGLGRCAIVGASIFMKLYQLNYVDAFNKVIECRGTRVIESNKQIDSLKDYQDFLTPHHSKETIVTQNQFYEIVTPSED